MNRSLQHKLSAWISLAIIGIAVIAGLVAFLKALDEAHSAQDNHLRQTGKLIGRLNALSPASTASARMNDIDFDERVVLRFLADRNGNKPALHERPPVFSKLLQDGLQTVTVGQENWRVFVITTDDGSRWAVAQQTATRDALARARALRTLLPFLLLVPLLLTLVAVLIRTSFRPLRQLAWELGRRPAQDLSELADNDLPSEVQPLVIEINSLLRRVQQSMSQQRRFVADAAHELRSPLTAMSLQAEWLAEANLPADAAARLGALRDGLARTRIMLDQLLAMARTQETRVEPTEAVSLQHIIRQVLEDLIPLAEEKQLDLGMIGNDDAGIVAHPVDLTVLVKNLVDNAVRYSPRGGGVDIRIDCSAALVTLTVDDSGPGIPEAERERVFDPFYRVLGNGQLGSGLGLSIVRAIAASIDAAISLEDAPPPRGGLRAAVRFGRAVRSKA